MPLTAEHKQQSREKILLSAHRLFTSQGYENTSIDQVMNDAQLTRGAFYAHFSSKEELYREAIMAAASRSSIIRDKPDSVHESEWLQALVDEYLSMGHVKMKRAPCALAFLVTDVAIREKGVRNTYTNVFKGLNKRLARLINSYSNCDENKVLAATAMMIGGVAVGRALNDEKMTRKLLNSCRESVKSLLEKT